MGIIDSQKHLSYLLSYVVAIKSTFRHFEVTVANSRSSWRLSMYVYILAEWIYLYGYGYVVYFNMSEWFLHLVDISSNSRWVGISFGHNHIMHP